MKKNYFLSALAVGAMLLSASCSQEETPAPAQDGNIRFNVSVPGEIMTKAMFGTGELALNLNYAIYEAGQTQVLREGTGSFVGLHSSIDVNLPIGKAYDIVFWASAPGAPYTFSAADQTVTVDYSAMNAYSDTYDGFFKAENGFVIVAGQKDYNIVLRRPFAQLNIGARDFEDATEFNLDFSTTSVGVNNVYTTLNLISGAVSNPVNVNFNDIARPAADYEFPLVNVPYTYQYLSMNYLLVEEKSNHTVTFNVADASYPEQTFTDIPLQRNHRTNIYGQILTSPASFDIVIDPLFENPDYNVEEEY